MQRLVSGFLISTMLLAPVATFADEDVSFNPGYLISDAEMFDVNSMSLSDIQTFLTRGALASHRERDLDGVNRSAAEMIHLAAQEYEISPKFLLTLLQREQSLVEDDYPSQRQLDWAMGYGVCDDCSKDDPRLKKFKGFPNQVWFAAERIRESYLYDLERRGFTETGVGPNIEMTIDGTLVTPVNFATSSLYTYTPHLHGNENFVKIWSKWFTRTYLSGTLLQDNNTGGIFLVQNGTRRPITSRSAFYSRFNEALLIPASTTEIEKYPLGTAISFPNYSLLRSPTGVVYLIVDDTRRGFTSQEAFRAIGFSPDEIVDVEWGDLDPYEETESITTTSVYPQGALLQDKISGGVFYVENGQKYPIHSREILQNRFGMLSIVPVEHEDLESYKRTDAVLFADGTLVAAEGSPDVFVISEGKRHLIEDEITFKLYGWSFDKVIWTNERSVLLHPLAEESLSTELESELIDVASY
ncbi:hypothetical protein HOI18_04840 [Candidatus Uhrbacteria bacterium]|nr:hypothetical protein [Candidatus Uhrbacteria bacterium]